MNIRDAFQEYHKKTQEWMLTQQKKNDFFNVAIVALKNEIDLLKKEIKDLKKK